MKDETYETFRDDTISCKVASRINKAIASAAKNPCDKNSVYCGLSLAGDLAIETAESYGECLHCAQRIAIIHGEHVLGGATELHDNILGIRVVHQLKVLHRGLRDTAVKVEHIGLGFIIPNWRLVVQLHNVVHVLKHKRRAEYQRIRI